jgi:phospholipid transport system substrate-binding protein
MALIFLSLVMFITTDICLADDALGVTECILKSTINQGIDILKNKESSDEQKLQSFDTLLAEKCHTDLMSMLALGKKGWVSFMPDQRVEFTKAFITLMTRTYYNKLSQADVTNVKVTYKDNIEVSKSKRTLKTVMSNSDEGFDVDYKFALRQDHWAIYDMEIEGISLIASYRSQFTDFLKTRSAADLLTEMQSNEQKFTAKTVVK